MGVLFQHVAVAEAYLPPGLARVCAPPYAQPGSKAAAATVGAEGNYKHWRGSFGSCGRVRRPSGRRSRVAVNLAKSKSSWGIRTTAAMARPGRWGGPRVTPWRHRASGRPRPESAGALGRVGQPKPDAMHCLVGPQTTCAACGVDAIYTAHRSPNQLPSRATV